MSLTIHPDPQEPAGGYAFLELPAGSLGQGPVAVAVMELYANRWLGPPEGGTGGSDDVNWQGARHDFGPYPVHAHDGADWVRIGPEIVNRIDEYTPLRLNVGARVADVTWPDDVAPRAGAAVLGGLQPSARPVVRDAGAALVGKPPEPTPEPTPEPPVSEEPAPPPGEFSPARNGPWAVILLVAALIVALGAAWWFYPREPAPVVAGDGCSGAQIGGGGDFGQTEKAIRACGDALSADTVLKIVEDGAERNDPAALLLFGTLYDGAQLDERIETVIGLTFEHDAARAAEYYARALAAGSPVARARLAATCAQLAGSDQTLAKGAHDDFCR